MSQSLDIINSSEDKIEDLIFGMEMALGVLQHHDAVAGTAQQHVADDYIRTGLKSINAFNDFYKQVKKEEFQREAGEIIKTDTIKINLFWNETGKTTGLSQMLEKGQNVLVNLYNPGAKGIIPIRLKVPSQEIKILSERNVPIEGDVVCLNPKDASDCELLFNLKV